MRAFRASLLLTVAWPFAAFAQFDLGEVPSPAAAPAPLFTNAIEIGTGYQDVESAFFGRYGGRTKAGNFVFGEGTFSSRPAWDTGNGRFFDAQVIFNGQNLPSVATRFGVQGRWRVNAAFESFTMYKSDGARSPFDGVGSARLTLPAGWVGAASSLLFPSLQASLQPVELKVRWQTVGGDFVMNPKPGYEARIHFDRRDRDGLKWNALPFGPESTFPVGIFFPQTVDYQSNHMTASLGYADGPLQWKAAYSLSTFHNAVPAMTVQNSYSRSIGISWPAGAFAGFPFAFGQYSLPPDNVAHQMAMTGGYAITPQLRLTAKLSYGIQTQNEPFLPYTTSPNLTVNTPLPRTSLNGDVRKTFANVTLTGRQGKAFDFTAAYTFDDRDNRTPKALFSYVPNDSQDQPSAALNGINRYIRYNLPHSFTFQQARLEAGYKLAARTRLSVYYSGDFRRRTYQEVARTNEHTIRAKAQTTFSLGSGWIGYTYANRTGSEYLDYVSWNASHTTNYIAAGPQNQSIEYPLLRRYNLADRRRHEVKTGASLDLTPRLVVSVSGGTAKDDYLNSRFGLTSSYSLLGDVDVAYTIKDKLTLGAFYTLERLHNRQNGYFLFNANETNPAQIWTASNRDRIQSVGAKLDWTVKANKLRLGASYTLSDGNTHIDVADTPFTAQAVVAQMPDALMRTHNVGLNAEYQWHDTMAFRAGYTLERHVTDDWRYLASLTPVAQILGSGELAPRYNAHVVWISTRKRF